MHNNKHPPQLPDIRFYADRPMADYFKDFVPAMTELTQWIADKMEQIEDANNENGNSSDES